MTLQELRDLLLQITDKVYHFEAAQESSGRYIVWQETGGRALSGSNRRQEVIRDVQIDLYTEEDFDPMVEQILNQLEDAGIAVNEPTTVYDPDTCLIRHIIECEVAG